MATYHLNQAKANLSSLVALAGKGEEVVITRYGKPVARLCAVEKPEPKSKRRVLGFHAIDFRSDLLEPTDASVIDGFYRDGSYGNVSGR